MQCWREWWPDERLCWDQLAPACAGPVWPFGEWPLCRSYVILLRVTCQRFHTGSTKRMHALVQSGHSPNGHFSAVISTGSTRASLRLCWRALNLVSCCMEVRMKNTSFETDHRGFVAYLPLQFEAVEEASLFRDRIAQREIIYRFI